MQRTVGPFAERVVWPTRVGDPHGPTRKQARGSAWRRTSYGFYVPADTPRTPEQRVAEASVVVPPSGCLTGWAALRWSGGRWFEGTTQGGCVEQPVSVSVLARSVRLQPGIAVVEERLEESEIVLRDGLRVATASRATCFEMRRARSVVESVVAADLSALSDLSSLGELRRYLDEHSGQHGSEQARRALSLAHENSWSPMETRLRMVWILDAGLPSPLVNAPVFDLDGRHIATPDLLDIEAGLVVEYDGSDHLSLAQRADDVGREDRLRAAGLSYLTVLAEHMRDTRALADRLCAARSRALAQRAPRRWTVEVPSWWTMLDTVDRRRAARNQSREVWPAGEPLPIA